MLLNDLDIVENHDYGSKMPLPLHPKPPEQKKSPVQSSNPRSRIAAYNSQSSSGASRFDQELCSKPTSELSIDDLLEVLDQDSPSNKKTNGNGGRYGGNSYTSRDSFQGTSHSGTSSRSESRTGSNGDLVSLHSGGGSTRSLGSSHTAGSTSFGGGNSGRCVRPVLSGDPVYARGVKTSSFTKAACNNLRCTSCNFTVLLFKNHSWDGPRVNYMFFRNNMPNEQKLQRGLSAHTDVRSLACAYCCQCSWVSVQDEEIDVGSVKNGFVGDGGAGGRLPWICGGH